MKSAAGRPRRFPTSPRTPRGRRSPTDPSTWSSFDAARDAYLDGEADGIGFSLGDGWVGVDLDKCRDARTGAITSQAWHAIEMIDSYTESSPSGGGVHILARGTLPSDGRKRGPIEMYSDGRYFTVTGHRLPSSPDTIHERTEALAAFHGKVFGPRAAATTRPVVPRPIAPDDPALIQRAGRARNGAKFVALWHGDTSGYASRSEADLALCMMLAFWTGRDAGRIDALFRQSGLMRPKWETRRGRVTYGAGTIDTALTRCQQTYVPREASSPDQRRAGWTPAATVSPAVDALDLVELGALLDEPDEAVEWIVTDRLAFGSVNLLAGRPKAGKSTLARALALAVARGESWLGSRCNLGRVLYVALEDKRSEVRRHLRNMGATGNESIRLLIGQAPRLLLDKLAGLIAAGDTIDLLIIDTAQRLLAVKDTNDYAQVTTAFEPILALARTHGTCIVLLHHAGKADRAGIEQILGSTAWAGSVDNVLLLNRTDKYRVLSSVQRIGPDLEETVVQMDETTGDVHLAGSRYLVDRQIVAGRMFEVVAAAGPGGLPRPDLLAAIDARRDLKLKGLALLAADERIARTGDGTSRNHPHVYALVAPREPGSETATMDATGFRGSLIEREPGSVIQESLGTTATKPGSRERVGSHGSHHADQEAIRERIW